MNKIKIIIVEDNQTQLKTLTKIIEDREDIEEIIFAEDGEAGLESIRSNPDIGLILTDYNMPRMSGIDLIRAVRGDKSISQIPIIILSAEVSKENMLEAIEAGADMEILKPFTKNDLMKAIDYVIENKEPKDSLNSINEEKLLQEIQELREENKSLKKELEELKSQKRT